MSWRACSHGRKGRQSSLSRWTRSASRRRFSTCTRALTSSAPGSIHHRRRRQGARFRERVADFKGRTKDLGNEHLIKLLDAIALVAGSPDPYPRGEQMMVVEMAAAFLLVEHVIDHFSSPADDLGVQIVIMGGWLLDAATGRSTGEPPPGLRRDLTERIGALQLRAGEGDPRQPASRGAGARRVRAAKRRARHARRTGLICARCTAR